MTEKINYQWELDRILERLEGTRSRLLLHTCCAPCATYVLEYLLPRFDITVYFFNPNIQPREEYELRLNELRKLLPLLGGVPLIEGGYYDAEWGDCAACIGTRIRGAAELAASGGFDWFCSTLSISPHKNARLINELGFAASEQCGVNWLPNEFKKRDGFLRSTQLCKEYGVYRQSYCGCLAKMYS